MQNARSDRVCLDFSLLRFFVSRQRNEEERYLLYWCRLGFRYADLGLEISCLDVWLFGVCCLGLRYADWGLVINDY
jgi:hypothetical protein